MCGRYQRRADKQRIAEAFQLGDVLPILENDNAVRVFDDLLKPMRYQHNRCLPLDFIKDRKESVSLVLSQNSRRFIQNEDGIFLAIQF